MYSSKRLEMFSWGLAVVAIIGLTPATGLAQTEACCLPDGSCDEMPPWDCEAMGGWLPGYEFCEPGICGGIEMEACCWPDGSCTEELPWDCEAMGGWLPGYEFCEPGICGGGEMEACCWPDGSCTEELPWDCEAMGGWLPGYEFCEPGICGGGEMEACCLPDGSCIQEFPYNCDAIGGTPMGPGSMCSEMMEACCLEDGICLDADPICCMLMGGTPQGPGSACVDMLIACCLDDGSCLNVDPICCDDLGGTPGFEPNCLGDLNQNGIDDACEIIEPEACCFEDGTCRNLIASDCLAQGGTPMGPGTICNGMMEACCLEDGMCLDADPICCMLMGGTPQGPGSACVDMLIACCLDDGSCLNVDPICCDDLGGTPGFEPNCLGDLNHNGIDDACEIITEYKWEQPPDLDVTGMDVNASWFFGDMPYVLADDFPCTQTGPLTEIHIWGSWYQDYMPFGGDPMAVEFTLSIHADIPVGPDGHSIPGELLWSRPFLLGEFIIGEVHGGLLEGWLNPPDLYEFPGDTVCFEYIFVLGLNEFVQQGTPDHPVVYWLDVHADPLDMQAMFGWKTTPLEFQWNDNAVWGMGLEPYAGPWQELYYPPNHEYWPEAPLDLAFTIIGEAGPWACCFEDGGCLDISPDQCIEMGGWPGFEQTCQGDVNQNGTDDACEEWPPWCPGDMDCDGDVDFDDIDPFVLSLSGPDAYYAVYPDCNWLHADCDGDGDVDFDDIDAFVALIGTECPAPE